MTYPSGRAGALDILRAERLAQPRVVLEKDLADRQAVRGLPVAMPPPEKIRADGSVGRRAAPFALGARVAASGTTLVISVSNQDTSCIVWSLVIVPWAAESCGAE